MRRSHHLTHIAVLAVLFLLAANGLLGALLTSQSGNALRTQIRARMLDVADSAAALLDGDSLALLTAEGKDEAPYQDAMDTLRAFQEHVELAYIYGIRDMGDGTFTFTIDPTVDDPAEFGELVKTTDALLSASRGVSAVDDTAYEDPWGRFYSAYSPVFDSKGRVAGIVGVDFNAAWYEAQIARQRYTVLTVSGVSLLIGALIVLIITREIRKRFMELNAEISSLTVDMGELSQELRLASGQQWKGARHEESRPRAAGSGTMEELSDMVREVREEMREYIADAHALAYTDALTGAGNRTAYFNEVDRINRQIGEGGACFSVAVFDINGLKKVNDEMGHGYGDKLIIDVANALKAVFQAKNVYRIGGDEFVAVLDAVSLDGVNDLFATLERTLAAHGEKNGSPLSVSKGAAFYRAGEDRDFSEAFHRADEAMYADKARYYSEHDDRRRQY